MANMHRETIRKRIISATLDEDVLRAMEQVRKEMGISVSVQIQLALKGNRVVADKRAGRSPSETINIDPAVHDRLKAYGTGAMTYNEILSTLMDNVDREAFFAEARRLAANPGPQTWVRLEDVE